MKNSVTAKLVASVAGLSMALSMALPVGAQTAAELSAQVNSLLATIAALQAQLAALQGGGSATMGTTFTMDLTIGSTGSEVVALQTFLESKGHLVMPVGVAKGYFGSLTQSALAKYQMSKGITPAVGYFGPITRAAVNAEQAPAGGGTTGGGTTGGGTTGGGAPVLSGGAGSVDSYKLISGLTNEKVGEDDEDVEVMGLEVEVDEGSDLELTAIRLVFNEGTAGSDFDEYASEVSVWLGGEEVGRLDGDEFDSDNNWTKTITLEDGAIIEAGDTEDLVVAVSGVSNIDTNDAGDTWTVDITQVRFRDAAGDSTSEDPGTDTRTFSFETFATASDINLKIVEDDDSVNDAHVIDVHATDDTTDVPVLSFTLEAEGDSDLEIRKMSASTTVGTATNVDDLVKEITLWIDGEEVASGLCIENDVADDCVGVGAAESYYFDDVDYTISAGDTVEAEIRVTFNSTGDALNDGDTLTVVIGESSTDDSTYFDVRDETGTKLADGDLTGSATGGAHAVYDVGIQAEFVSASESVRTGALANDPDIADFTIVFDVTAFGGEAYIDGDVVAGAVPAVGTDGLVWATTTDSTTGTSTSGFTAVGTATLSASGDTSDDVTTSGSAEFKIDEDETRTFTFKVSVPAGGDNVNVGTRITGIKWDTATGDSTAYLYNFNMSDYRTDTVTGLYIR
jgi:peptidoglycan hydrolase-like protein with peptidoglycan-binding domain